MSPISRLALDERGAETVEYALLISFVAIAVAASLTILGSGVANIWANFLVTLASIGM